MSETRRTLIFAAVAVVLALLAVVSAPRRITPNAFLDQGEPFFPGFTDPNEARTLEVIDFDNETGSAKPFKVTFSNGRWTIPSHHDHPADGKDRLAKTAAGVIGIKKDDFRSDNVSDHEACGVIDPLDDTATSLEGRGQRVTLKGENDVILADFIIGGEIPDRENFRFVRVPGQKRVYAVRMDIDISTSFKDWIDADLLLIEKDDVDKLTFRNYSINERTGRVNERDLLILTRDGLGADWKANKAPDSEEVDQGKINVFLQALRDLSIEGVRPKPAGLSASLTRTADSLTIGTAEMLSLQSKGYFFSRDGRLLSNEGELEARTTEGVTYTLRFGEVVYGEGLAVTAGTKGDAKSGSAPGENRYLFITTDFDPSLFPEPEAPANTDFVAKADSLWTDEDRRNKELKDAYDEWRAKIEAGLKRSRELNVRFARWYYVISSSSFESLKLTRGDIMKSKQS